MMGKRSLRVGVFGLLIGAGLSVLAAGAVARIPPVEGTPPEVTALQVSAPGPPRYVFGSDGREHVDYDLVITNAFTAEVTLKSLTVTEAGQARCWSSPATLLRRTRIRSLPASRRRRSPLPRRW